VAKQLQLRKGTATEHNTFTGANGEVTVDTTNKTLRVHDGVKAGGTPLLNASLLVDSTSTVKGVARFATATEVINKSNVSASVTPSDTATIAQSTDLGVGQSWQNFTGSRSSGVTYLNNTGKPIMISVIATGRDAKVTIHVSNVLVVMQSDTYDVTTNTSTGSTIVPDGATYTVISENKWEVNVTSWAELR
jgi:hypothetical protein